MKAILKLSSILLAPVVAFTIGIAAISVLAQSPAPSTSDAGLMRVPPGSSTVPAISDNVSRNSGLYFGNGFTGTIGHEAFAGATPSLGATCGGSPTIVGTDAGGTITAGTGAPTSCVVTFAVAYAAIPSCSVSWQTNLASMVYTVSTTALTITQTGTSSNKINYSCQAGPGG